ncbi:hypothetical protein ACWDTD_13730 [Gordonia sp. NPDC003425]
MTGDASPVRTALTRAGRTFRPNPTSPPIRQVLADRRELISSAPTRTQSPLSSMRHYAGTTPGKLILISMVLSVAALVTGWYASTTLKDRTASLQTMIDRAEPLAEAAQVLYSSLSIADAAANSAFISGGLETPQLRERYSDALATASASLLIAAGDTGTPGTQDSAVDRAMNSDLKIIATALPVYSGLIETARTNNRLNNPVGSAYLGQASALMQSRILPAAQRLYERRSAAIADPQQTLTVPPWGVYAALLVLAMAFVAVSRYLAKRTRRRFNVGILAALVAILGGLVWLLASGLLSVAATSAAKSDGAEPLRQLTEARILTQQARSAEMLSLLRRGDQAAQQSAFEDSTAQIGRILTELRDDQGSAGSLSATQLTSLRGALDQWTTTDEQVRQKMEAGDFIAAREMTVGESPQSSATSYDAVDAALVEGITTTRTSFRDDINTAQRVLGFTGNGILALTVFATVALVLGLIPRIREYR